MTWWGAALDQVLRDKGWSKTKLGESGFISHRQVLRSYKGVYGPSAVVIQRILSIIGASWADWAKACEATKSMAAEPVRSVTSARKMRVISAARPHIRRVGKGG